jgi:hypothetical protein
MREIRTSGSEGGAAEPNRPLLPLSLGNGDDYDGVASSQGLLRLRRVR